MLGLKLTVKNAALLTCFTALYVIFYSLPVFPIIGISGAAIRAAAAMAPITGILLGPFLGTLSALLGGLASFFIGRFSPLSLIATSVTALCAGLLHIGRRRECALLYLLLLVSFGLYPIVGPFWLYPLMMWFQIVVFLMLVSPFYSLVFKREQDHTNSKGLFPAFFLISLISTLAGQIAGSLAFETIFWPAFIGEVETWAGIWKVVTWIYPVERVIIAVFATIIGVPLFKALKAANLV